MIQRHSETRMKRKQDQNILEKERTKTKLDKIKKYLEQAKIRGTKDQDKIKIKQK